MALSRVQRRYAAPTLFLLLGIALTYLRVASHATTLDEAQALLLAQLGDTSPSAQVNLVSAQPATFVGTHVVRTVSLGGGTDVLAHLLRTDSHALLELDISDKPHQFDHVPPGVQLRVDAVPINPQKIHVLQFMVQQRGKQYMKHADGHEHAEDVANSGPDYAYLEALPAPQPWVQHRVVTEMTTLFMISSICGCDAATTVQDLELALFDQPGSRAKTLQSGYWECSQGITYMNSSNSKVVGPIDIPCSYNSSGLFFSAQDCTFSDADGWIKYASMQAQEQYGVDLSLYRHRVLLMPMYYIYEAGCRWLGLGTLGPDETGPDGSYLYSSVWVTGEYWKRPIAFMHELGHTEYLHHSGENGCVYCDYSCIMGDCCDSRCFNPVHNWQLGWGSPIAVLNHTNMPIGVTLTYTLPTQQSTSVNMLLVVPDWMDGYAMLANPYGIFLGYSQGGKLVFGCNLVGGPRTQIPNKRPHGRQWTTAKAKEGVDGYVSACTEFVARACGACRTESGRYDDDMPAEYLYATNIYTYDGGVQTATRYTWVVTNVGTGQEYRNETWQLVIKQQDSSHQAATVTLCRWNELHETSCNDGIDNDCDGLVDTQDPDCSASSSAGYPAYSTALRPPAPYAPPSPEAPMQPCSSTQCPVFSVSPINSAATSPFPSPPSNVVDSALAAHAQQQAASSTEQKKKHPPGWLKKHKKSPPPPRSLSQDTLAPPVSKPPINWGHFPPAPPEGVPIPQDMAWKYKKRAPPSPTPSTLSVLPGSSKLEVQTMSGDDIVAAVLAKEDTASNTDDDTMRDTNDAVDNAVWMYGKQPHKPDSGVGAVQHHHKQVGGVGSPAGYRPLLADASLGGKAGLLQRGTGDASGEGDGVGLEQLPTGTAWYPPPPQNAAAVSPCQEDEAVQDLNECMGAAVAARDLLVAGTSLIDRVVDVDALWVASELGSHAEPSPGSTLVEVVSALDTLDNADSIGVDLAGTHEAQEGEQMVDGEPLGVGYKDSSLRFKFRLTRSPPGGLLRGERRRSRKG